jgi:hypothetical protein
MKTLISNLTDRAIDAALCALCAAPVVIAAYAALWWFCG